MAVERRRKRLSLKQLESYLQDLDDFSSPRVELEQYATPPHIAALMINTIDLTYDDLKDKFVADIGCGTGRLTMGSLLCDASMVYGFDIDSNALRIGMDNIRSLFSESDEEESNQGASSTPYVDCTRFNFIQLNIEELAQIDHSQNPMSNIFDTVIMNPPFGTKNNQGLDLIFLKSALDMSKDVVYSLHKTATRSHILSKCTEWGVEGKPIAQIKYNLDNTYKFHRKNSVNIDVDFWRIKSHHP